MLVAGSVLQSVEFIIVFFLLGPIGCLLDKKPIFKDCQVDTKDSQYNREKYNLASLSIFIINASMSTFAVTRWSQRVENIEPAGVFWEKIDERFPDERMERIYTNMVFSK